MTAAFDGGVNVVGGWSHWKNCWYHEGEGGAVVAPIGNCPTTELDRGPYPSPDGKAPADGSCGVDVGMGVTGVVN